MTQDVVTQAIEEARKVLRRGDAAGAEAVCRRVLAEEPGRREAVHLMGLIVASRGEMERAIELFGRAAAGWDWAVVHYDLGRALAIAGRRREAAIALERAVELEPRFAEAWLSLGNLCYGLGDAAKAVEAFRRHLAIQPRAVAAHNNLAVALAGLGRFEEAAAAGMAAIGVNPNYPQAYRNLSNVTLELLRIDEAVRYGRKATELSPTDAAAYLSLGNALRARGELAGAAAAFERATQLDGNFIEAYLSAVPALVAVKQFEKAVSLAREAAERRPDGVTCFSLGEALEAAGKLGDARGAYLRAKELDPDHPNCEFALAALEARTQARGAGPSIAPPRYIAELFDDMAPRFEEHLVGTLGYRVPEMLRDALDGLGYVTGLDVLDLGCGTGLCGRLLRSRAGRIDGIDLSPKMLEIARRTGCYDRLDQADIETALKQFDGAYDVILAADVFIYIGDVANIFGAAAKGLRPGGVLLFSLEALDDAAGQDYVLQGTRRYGHLTAYVRRLAGQCGLREVVAREVTIRSEVGEPVMGWVMGMKREK